MRAVDATSLVIVLDAELDDAEAERVAAAGTLVVLHTVDDERLKNAALLLPATSMAEENGSYVNRDGRVQRFTGARAAPGMARPAWWIAAEAWALGASGRQAPGAAGDAFARLSETVPALGGLTYRDLGHTGRVLEPAAAMAR